MKRQVIASFELPKIQAAESQPNPLFIYIFFAPNFVANREEKSLRHVAMVAKFLDDNKQMCFVHLLHKAGLSN